MEESEGSLVLPALFPSEDIIQRSPKNLSKQNCILNSQGTALLFTHVDLGLNASSPTFQLNDLG